MGIDFPVRLRVYGEGDAEYVADSPETARLDGGADGLSDADLDLVSAGAPCTEMNTRRSEG